MCVRRLLCIALLASLSLPAHPQQLLKDINQEGPDSDPGEFAVMDDRFLFRAETAEYGAELWISDGTEGGTHLVRDIMPGPESSDPSHLVSLGDRVIFTTRYPDALWASDGTHDDTVLLREDPGFIWQSKVLNDRLFIATFTSTGMELWATDGTPEGTTTIEGGERLLAYQLRLLTTLRDSLYYIAFDGAPSIWRLHPEDSSAEAFLPSTIALALQATENELFFLSGSPGDKRSWASDGLWVSDGSVSGTRIVRSFPINNLWDDGGFIGVIGNRVIFLVDDGAHGIEPWVSDGTEMGTMLLKDTNPGEETGVKIYQESLQIGDQIFFVGRTNEKGYELWVTDGTAEGTRRISDFHPSYRLTAPLYMAEFNRQLLFNADDGIHGKELWISDGTAAGTRMLFDFNPGQADGYPSLSTPFYDGFIVGMSDGIHGSEPFFSDGSESGTRLIADIHTGGTQSEYSSDLTTVDNKLYFTASLHTTLWISYGTDTGTYQIDSFDGSRPYIVGTLKGKLLISVQTENYERALVALSDPTSPWEMLTKPSDGITLIRNGLTSNDGQALVIPAKGDGFDTELWYTDGTPLGAKRITYTSVRNHRRVDGILGFVDDKWIFHVYASPNELWSTNGTETGTEQIGSWAADDRKGIAVLPDMVVFASRRGYSLIRTDGTASGTRLIRYEDPVDAIAAVGDRAYFSMSRTGSDADLWITDGTFDGTLPVADIAPGAAYSTPGDFIAGDNRLFVSAEDGVHGRELWVSDGTQNGTSLVADINPDGAGSEPKPLLAAEQYLLFSAEDGIHGRELWITDGTAEQTYMLADIATGVSSASPRSAVRVGDTMYFIADHPDYGREIWKLDMTTLGVAAERRDAVAESLEMLPPFPNPFWGRAEVPYSLSRPSDVRLSLFNVLGQKVRVIEHARKTAGLHSAQVDGNGLAPGVYFLRLSTSEEERTSQIVRLR